MRGLGRCTTTRRNGRAGSATRPTPRDETWWVSRYGAVRRSRGRHADSVFVGIRRLGQRGAAAHRGVRCGGEEAGLPADSFQELTERREGLRER